MADSRSRRSAERAASPDRPLAAGAAALTTLLADTLPAAATRWTVAFSGGADSTALLLIAQRAASARGAQLTALHVHHGLHPDADAWVAHAQTVADAVQVPLQVVRVDVIASGQGIEDAARQARYRAFADVDAELLLLAHHRDDQIETVLLHLLRGAGTHGAAGMPAVRWLRRSDGRRLPLLRPLLDFDRRELLAWVVAAGLGWIEDPSNVDADYSRGLLRTQVLPVLRPRFPVNAALGHAAARFREAAALLDERADEDCAACSLDGRLAAGPFARLSAARQRNALYRALALAGARVAAAARLEELRRQFVAADVDAQVCVPLGDHVAYVWRQQLWIVAAAAASGAVRAVRWSGEACVDWCGGAVHLLPGHGDGLSRARLLAAGVTLRARQGGERLRIAADRPRQRLKTLWQAAAVPPWLRDELPLLWAGDTLVWVPGLPVDPAFAAAPDEVAIRPHWRPAR